MMSCLSMGNRAIDVKLQGGGGGGGEGRRSGGTDVGYLIRGASAGTERVLAL